MTESHNPTEQSLQARVDELRHQLDATTAERDRWREAALGSAREWDAAKARVAELEQERDELYAAAEQVATERDDWIEIALQNCRPSRKAMVVAAALELLQNYTPRITLVDARTGEPINPPA